MVVTLFFGLDGQSKHFLHGLVLVWGVKRIGPVEQLLISWIVRLDYRRHRGVVILLHGPLVFLSLIALGEVYQVKRYRICRLFEVAIAHNLELQEDHKDYRSTDYCEPCNGNDSGATFLLQDTEC